MSEVIKYSFKGEIDVDLLAKNMKEDKTPIVIVITNSTYSSKIYILKSFRRKYKGKNLSLSLRSFFTVCEHSEHNLLYSSDGIIKADISFYLSNIKAIIKSHEDATLPKTKVIGVTTTAKI